MAIEGAPPSTHTLFRHAQIDRHIIIQLRHTISSSKHRPNLGKVQQNVPKSVSRSCFVPDCPVSQSQGNSPNNFVAQWQNLLSADGFTKHRNGDDMWGLLQARCERQWVHEGFNRLTLKSIPTILISIDEHH